MAIDTSSTDISHIQQYKTIRVLARQLGVSNHYHSFSIHCIRCTSLSWTISYSVSKNRKPPKKQARYIELTPCCTIKFQDHCCPACNILMISALCPLQVFLVAVVEALKHRLKNAITKLHIHYVNSYTCILYSHIKKLTYTVLLFRMHAYNHTIVTNK